VLYLYEVIYTVTHQYCQPFSILREGITIGVASYIVGAALSFLSLFAFIPFALFGTWALYFFRDPERVPPTMPNAVASPADGFIVDISLRKPEKSQSKEQFTCISIFMNAFDVHVNRMPIDAVVKKIYYIPGKFLNASLDKASSENERCIYVCEHKKFGTFFITQIAGFVARRIVPFCKEKNVLSIGHRIGLIRFGSRVDLFLPKNFSIVAQKGQKTIAGETILAFTPTKKT